MDFGSMFQTWIAVLTRPGEQTFAEEVNRPNASLGTALIWIVVAGVIYAVFSMIRVFILTALDMGGGMMQTFVEQADLPPEMAEAMIASGAGGAGSAFGTLCGSIIFVPIGFLIGAAIYFAIAKLVGGQASFDKHTYALATFSAPILIINGLVSVVPIVGGCLGFVIGIYSLVLTYFAMKAVHKLTSGKAAIVAFTPMVLGICCAVGVFALAMTIAAGAMSGEFSSLLLPLLPMG